MFAVLTLIAALALPQDSYSVAVKVSRLSSPKKALRFETVVFAPIDDVWTVFTTKAGLETWLWKDARVDLRPGGDWLVLFSAASTGGGTIVSFEPKRRLVVKALAPEKFPTVRKEGTTATFEFEPLGSKTRVTLTQTGWREGKEWDDAYEYLASGNAQLLTQLWNRFIWGPMDWSEPAGATDRPTDLTPSPGYWVFVATKAK
jgi:uncharacterized protein YndB with AHSA1/START domain